MKVLVMNAGSKDFKFKGDPSVKGRSNADWVNLREGMIDWTAKSGIATIKVKAQGIVLQRQIESTSRTEVTREILNTLWQGETQVLQSAQDIDVVGHRVVHGGDVYRDSCRITTDVKAKIDQFARFAPIHNPITLDGIHTIEAILGETIPQVAVFDTAFHATLPPAAYTYPGPHAWLDEGIRRYGFHGTSHRYCAERVAYLLGRELAELRLITCHLGNGASLTAIRNGESIDTTMGFTPLEGLMMGTRSGSVDPGILMYLMHHHGYQAKDLDTVLNKSSGLLGLSGVSADVRQILAAIAEGNTRAQLALDVYIHRLRSHIGAMLMSLQGLDVLIFTAGVGENAPLIRQAACESLGFLGVQLDPEKNAHGSGDQMISTPDSTVQVWVIHTQEDWMIAKQCWQVLHAE